LLEAPSLFSHWRRPSRFVLTVNTVHLALSGRGRELSRSCGIYHLSSSFIPSTQHPYLIFTVTKQRKECLLNHHQQQQQRPDLPACPPRMTTTTRCSTLPNKRSAPRMWRSSSNASMLGIPSWILCGSLLLYFTSVSFLFLSVRTVQVMLFTVNIVLLLFLSHSFNTNCT